MSPKEFIKNHRRFPRQTLKLISHGQGYIKNALIELPKIIKKFPCTKQELTEIMDLLTSGLDRVEQAIQRELQAKRRGEVKE